MNEDFLMRIIQKKLIDPKYEVSQEDIYKCSQSLEDRIIIANAYLRMLNDEQKLIISLIEGMKNK